MAEPVSRATMASDSLIFATASAPPVMALMIIGWARAGRPGSKSGPPHYGRCLTGNDEANERQKSRKRKAHPRHKVRIGYDRAYDFPGFSLETPLISWLRFLPQRVFHPDPGRERLFCLGTGSFQPFQHLPLLW